MKSRRRIWIPESPEINERVVELPPIKIGGVYTVELIESKSGKVKQHLEFPNLITDAGLNFIGSGISLDTMYTTLAVGTDGATPTTSDTSLGNQVATSTDNGGEADTDSTESSPVEYAYRRRIRIFDETEANYSLKELGWIYGGLTVNRSLFKDINGNPTTLVKTDEDYLRIVYEYRIFAPLNDVVGSIVIGPPACGSVDYTIRPQNVNQTDGWPSLLSTMGSYATPSASVHEPQVIGSRTGNNFPQPSAMQSTSSFGSYVADSFYRDMEYVWSYAYGNFDSKVNLITWNPWAASGKKMLWQMHCSQSMDKTNTNKLTLRFRQRWARV